MYPPEKKSMALLIKNVISVNYTYAIFKTFFDLINTFKNYNVLPGMEKYSDVCVHCVVNVPSQ